MQVLVRDSSQQLTFHLAVAQRESAAGRKLQRLHLPIFYSATRLTSWIIARTPDLLHAPTWLWRHSYVLCGAALAVVALAVGAALVV